MKKIVIIPFLIFFHFTHAQVYETRNKVYIPKNATVIKSVLVQACNDTVQAGHIVKTEYFRKYNDRSYTITHIDTIDTVQIFPFQKEIKLEIAGFEGWANLTIDEKDKSKIHIHPWLNPENKVEAGNAVRIIKNTLNCEKENDTTKGKKLSLKKDTTYNLFRVDIYDSTLFAQSSSYIEVYDTMNLNKIKYYLVDRYDRQGKYHLKLENREFISYKTRGFEFGPITIPFKYRFEHTENNIKVNSEFIADINIGVFGGYKRGRYRVRKEGDLMKQLANRSITVGGFVSLSTVTLDSLSTTAGEDPFNKDQTRSIGALSPGLGAMFSVYNFNFGAFIGWDVGFGSGAKNWNFHNKPWIGIGVGYGFTNFWKKQ